MSARRSWQDRQAAIARQPGECALHHPAMPPQPRLVLHALAGDAVGDPPSPQGGAAVPDVVALVRVQRRRAAAGPPARAFNGFRRVEQRREDRAVGAVRPRQPRRERDAPAADHQMALRVGSPRGSAAVRRVLADRVAPFFAGRLALSTLARDQSIRSAAPRRSRRRRWSRCQTPTAPHSRSRRQQVIPLPQPNSCGRSPQGIPPRAHRGYPPAPRDPACAGGPTWPRRLRRQQRPDRRPQVVRHHVMRAHARRSRHGCVNACQTC